MPTKEHAYPVNHLPGSRYRLIIRDVDFALRVYDSGGELISVNKMNLHEFQQNDEHPWLFLRKRYLIHYNNNDGGNGNLNLSIEQYYPDNTNPEIVRNIDLHDIFGPQVVEIPFILESIK